MKAQKLRHGDTIMVMGLSDEILELKKGIHDDIQFDKTKTTAIMMVEPDSPTYDFALTLAICQVAHP